MRGYFIINKINKKLIRVINNFNRVSKIFVKSLPFIKQSLVKKSFETELTLIKGAHEAKSKHPSILHFSINKAATQYVKSILKRCAEVNNIIPIQFSDYAFNTKFPFLDHLSVEEMEKYKHIFKKEGYLYSVFGGMVENIEELDKYKIVLVTRDPRDILVSRYYSIGYHHGVPAKAGDKRDKFLFERKKARESTIDDYVILESNRVHDTYSRYQTLLLEKYRNTYLTTYEHMVTNFNSWLKSLIEYCEFNLSNQWIQSLVEQHERKKPIKENIYTHLRKGKIGDHKEKLKPETIMYLDKKFKFIFNKLDTANNIQVSKSNYYG